MCLSSSPPILTLWKSSIFYYYFLSDDHSGVALRGQKREAQENKAVVLTGPRQEAWAPGRPTWERHQVAGRRKTGVRGKH